MREAERKLLKEITKRLETRIKEVQQETKEAFHQDDVWIKQAIERELIDWKITLERWRKSIKD